MALRRYTRAVDGTIPIQALLYNDETLLSNQDGVGIYDGLQKSFDHQTGTVYISSHRLFYIDDRRNSPSSFALDLSYVVQTDYYAGLFKSSPKVTLHLSGSPTVSVAGVQDESISGFESWECEVCAFRNPPGLSPAAARICSLCGVPRASVPNGHSTIASSHLSSSLPSSSAVSSSTSLHETSTSARSGTSVIACSACTFLNHPSLRACEICSTELPKPPRQLKSAPSSRPITPEDDDDGGTPPHKLIKVSFRKGGDKPFYAVLRRCLKSKAWEVKGLGPSRGASNSSESNNINDRTTLTKSGISGILRTVESSAQGRDSHLSDALHDLEALMVQAKDMVRLAAELNEKLTAASTTATNANPSSDAMSPYGSTSMTTLVPSTEPEEATFIRSSLSQLGLQMSDTPVTLDMIKDERKWTEELARELARILQGQGQGAPLKQGNNTGMMRERGVIALDEVWGGWNRARGVALIPPTTFLQVVPLLPGYTDPAIRLRTFTSGLSVLHTPPYTHAAFAARLSSFLAMTGPKTTIEVALEEEISAGLAAEMIGPVEGDGDICRDDGGNVILGGGSGTGVEVRWWANLFIGYVWDGQE